MFDDAGRVMFSALHAAALARYGAAHPCTVALAVAAQAAERAAVAAAEAELRALPESDQTALMAEAHRTLRSDPQAWLSLWRGGGRGQ